MSVRKSHGGDYPSDWAEIAHNTKNAAGNRCVRCGHIHEPETGHTLTVHHLDMNPSNCEWWNLAALCQKCHLHIQSKVIMERPYMFEHTSWFQPYVAGYYAAQNGLPTDRAYVTEHMAELLDYGRPQVVR